MLPHADRCAAAGRLVRSNPELSDRAIAASTGLSAKTVANIRARRGADERGRPARLGLDGRSRPVDPAEGRRVASRYLAANPHATLREIARFAGISPGTARDVRERLGRGEDPVPARLRSERTAATVPRPRAAPEPQRGAALRVLRNDPAIRYAEGGRRLLCMLDGPTGDWRELVDALPPHCTVLVAEAVQDCIRSWQAVARYLARKA
jgi:hypothetical protein